MYPWTYSRLLTHAARKSLPSIKSALAAPDKTRSIHPTLLMLPPIKTRPNEIGYLDKLVGEAPMSDEFNVFIWSMAIPLCDDLWLGMKARNIAIIDQGYLRPLE